MEKILQKIKLVCLLLVACGWCFILPATAFAATITLDLDVEFSGAAQPAGPMPWLTATFDDGGTPGSVTLTLDAGNLAGSEFVSGWYFNFGETLDLDLLVFGYVSGGPAESTIGVTTGVDAYKADGDGFFDILFSFATSGDSFGSGETVVYDITSSESITASSFTFGSTPNNQTGDSFFTAAHVQSIANENFPDESSGWIGDPVPIPGAAWLLASGLIGLIFFRRVKR